MAVEINVFCYFIIKSVIPVELLQIINHPLQINQI